MSIFRWVVLVLILKLKKNDKPLHFKGNSGWGWVYSIRLFSNWPGIKKTHIPPFKKAEHATAEHDVPFYHNHSFQSKVT